MSIATKLFVSLPMLTSQIRAKQKNDHPYKIKESKKIILEHLGGSAVESAFGSGSGSDPCMGSRVSHWVPCREPTSPSVCTTPGVHHVCTPKIPITCFRHASIHIPSASHQLFSIPRSLFLGLPPASPFFLFVCFLFLKFHL